MLDDQLELQLKNLIANIEDTLSQASSMQESMSLSIPAELRMATLLERQIIFSELQQAREQAAAVFNSIATSRNAVAQERATQEYQRARQSSETLARSNTALSKALDRARDAMERGASLESISKLVNLISQAIIESGTLIILLAKTSRDDVIREQARQLGDGLEQIDHESKRQQLKTLYGNRAKLQEQAAKFGGKVPIDLQNELDDTEETIVRLKQELGMV